MCATASFSCSSMTQLTTSLGTSLYPKNSIRELPFPKEIYPSLKGKSAPRQLLRQKHRKRVDDLTSQLYGNFKRTIPVYSALRCSWLGFSNWHSLVGHHDLVGSWAFLGLSGHCPRSVPNRWVVLGCHNVAHDSTTPSRSTHIQGYGGVKEFVVFF